ncbi:MAG: hypothetical protein LC734_11765 [Acidobacteria bacterium]|nr:hypothetical protein [Acidobacteriota bacterium]
MRYLKAPVLFAIAVGFSASVSAVAQVASFSDPNVNYAFDLPGPRWKVTVKPSTTNQNVEYVFGDRLDGHLEVRKITVAKDAAMPDILRVEEQKLQFLPGYVAGRDEVFRGRLNGTVFNYEFVRAGRPMSGRFYLLRADEGTIYLLRFTGFSDKLRSIRNQTDAIGRSFQVKRSS